MPRRVTIRTDAKGTGKGHGANRTGYGKAGGAAFMAKHAGTVVATPKPVPPSSSWWTQHQDRREFDAVAQREASRMNRVPIEAPKRGFDF